MKTYDYSQNGCYFVTICTKDRRCILSAVYTEAEKPSIIALTDGNAPVGRGALTPPQVRLTAIGKTVEKVIQHIDTAYSDVSVDDYVIMPNHVHLLISIGLSDKSGGVRAPRPTEQTGYGEDGGVRAPRPTVDERKCPSLFTVVRGLKALVTKSCGRSIWQISYYDHVIRSEAEALRVLQYIQTNPARWADDEYYQT